MTNEQFEALVRKLDQQAQNNPSTYRLKVLLLAMLGNAYLAAILSVVAILLIALLASIMVLKALAAKLILIVGFFLWMMLKALWVRIDPPSGTEIKPAQAPELFAVIDRLRRKLGAPRFHHALITDDFNAGVVQSPRLGIFGWPRNYLLIGLPLMKSLTVEQFTAVLAHEFGHLAKGHGRMSNWIYRQRLRWSRLMAVLDAQESKGSFLFKPFLNWFSPYFNAYSFPLARANEYEADATSARLTSPQAAAQALTSVNVVSGFLAERYWPQIHVQADDHPQPRFAPYTTMGHSVATELNEALGQTWLKQAMARQTDSADTHPALADRLRALGESPSVTIPAPGQAADRLLGAALESISQDFDQQWQEDILPSWEERHREVQSGRYRLANLNARFEGNEALSEQDAYDRAWLTDTFGDDPDAALEQFRALHQRAPDSPLVCLALGTRLLHRDDETGLELVQHAMRLDEHLTTTCCELLRDYHWRNDRKEEAYAWHERLVERVQLQEAADRERSQVTLRDNFEPHGLTEEALAPLRVQLKAIPGLRRAYLLKKRIVHFTDSPCYVLGFRVTGMFRLHSKQRVAAVLRLIQESVQFPGETLIINVEGDNYRFGRKFRWKSGARVI